MIDGLLEKMKRTKLTGSLKAVVFDQEIEELVGKIERTKSLLILTSNLCIPEQILGQLAPVIDAQQRADSRAVLATAGQAYRTPSDPSLYPSPSLVAQKSACISDESEPTALRKASGRRFRYRVSTWLLQCAWTLTAQRVYSGWMVSLQCHGRLPRDHPAAIACMEGDCPKMQSLFDAGQVSPHDEVQGESLAQVG